MLCSVFGTKCNLTVLGACCLAGCISQGSVPSLSSNISISSEVAVQLLRQGKIMLVDTRPTSERSGRHISQAIAIQFGPDPWNDNVTEQERDVFLAKLTAAGVSKDDPVVTVCTAGIRALAAAQFLRSLGFTNVKSVIGGYLGRDSDAGWQFFQ